MAIFENVSPKKVIDNKMHILYPVNLSDDDNVKGANSVHNCDSDKMKMDAMCGTIWINTDNDDTSQYVGFIHNTDTNSFKFRHPCFYPALFLYKDDDRMSGSVLNYDVWSYGHMLKEDAYESPHFKISDNGSYVPSKFVDQDQKSVYYLSNDNVIYDPLLSSYYIKIDESSNDKNKIQTYFMPSKFSQEYNKEWNSVGTKKEHETHLERNVDIMLKYLIDVNNNNTSYGSYGEYVDSWPCFDDSTVDDDYWWYANTNRKCYKLMQASLFPLYLVNETPNNKYNERGGKTSIGYCYYRNGNFKGRDAFHRIKSTSTNSHRQNALEYDVNNNNAYDTFTNYNVFSTINIGSFEDASQKNARTVSICNDAISLSFMDDTKYVKVFSNDSKWISVPYQNRMLMYRSTTLRYESNTKAIIPEYGDGIYTDKYLSPFTLDHYIRQANLEILEQRAGDSSLKRGQKLFISSMPIECGHSQEKDTFVLYNSANLINAIKWKDGDDIELEFENTSGVLIGDIIKYEPE